MKRLVIAAAATTALLFGGAGIAQAQETEPETEVVVEVEEELVAGDSSDVVVSGAEPDATIDVNIGDETFSGTVAADGTASIAINVPQVTGPIDGTVVINGREIAISSVIIAARQAGDDGAGGDDGAAEGDGTVQPTAVNTGDASTSSNNSTLLFAAAAGLFLIGGGAFIRLRSTRG